MAPMNDDYKKGAIGDDESGSGTGTGGSQGGAIEFRDFLPGGETKLPPGEEKQKLAEHKGKNSECIDKQKKLRDSRNDIKEGKVATAGSQYGNGAGNSSNYRKHPIIGNAAEFDGADPNMSLDPNQNEAETNSEKKEELTYTYQKKFENQEKPKFTPPELKMGG